MMLQRHATTDEVSNLANFQPLRIEKTHHKLLLLSYRLPCDTFAGALQQSTPIRYVREALILVIFLFTKVDLRHLQLACEDFSFRRFNRF